ncbi:MAG TPA: heavy metal translocating P-type ATPase [Propionibacteriaceae bacterium]|jgi:Cu+-exporting ATPase|nr:heavy metal translocating P-type ATPase [Propionibacteriaceae bacterium]
MTLDVAVQTIELDVQGMTCASCATRIEKKLNRLEGVNATVNYATEKATVHAGKGTSAQTLIETIEKTGYHATLPSDSQRDPDQELRQLRRRLMICAVLSLPVIMISMVPAWQFPWWQWVSFALACVVVTWGAWPFHRATLLNLQHGNATMDTLISIGTLAAFGWSAYALLFGAAGEIGFTHPFEFRLVRHAPTANLYLEAAVGITTFILLGRYLEARAKRRSGAAVRALLDLAPSEVTLLTADGETVVDISQLHVGDRFVVRPGERVATDGVIVSGHSALDTSTVTGESVPVEVGPGDAVVGATVNTNGRLVVEAARVGADTQLAQVVRMVEAAQSGKAAVQRLADRVSAVFVPIVIALAVATLGFWLGQGSGMSFAFTSAVAVLIIACPCALGLATPTALLVGTGRGAQLGILIRGPEVLESTRHLDTIVLDKTGTITEARMAVVSLTAGAGATTAEVIKAAGSAESGSDHPIAKAIAEHARTHGSLDTVTKLDNHPGLGVLAELSASAAAGATTDADTSVVVGRVKLLEEEGLQVAGELQQAYAAEQAQGRTAVLVGWGGEARGVIAVADVVKPTSAEAVRDLRWLDLRPVLLTGDHAAAARTVAAEVGIDDVIADVLPQQKVAEVVRLQEEGHRVAMVGDGVNDAAALAQSDLGIALGTGTDAAIHASDLTLISGDLRVAADAVRLSRATLRTIHGNLWWAFAYNVVALPLAAAGFLNPMIAAAAMALSSVFVVTNSMRLLRFR